MLEDIYHGRIAKGDIDPQLTKLTAEILWDATTGGYGRDFPTANYDSPDWNMLKNLQNNVYSFSAAKDFKMLEELTGLLVQDNVLVSFSDFKKAASKITQQYNTNWLQTEYNLAVAGGQSASKWVDIQKSKGAIPLLSYETVGDSRVREQHRLLDGVIKPVNDDFWNKYYPPNGWGCRCTTRQLRSGSVTLDSLISYPEVPKMFQTNLAKHGLVFPAGHSYWDGVPNSILEQGRSLITPDTLLMYEAENGKKVTMHIKHGDIEKPKNIATAKTIADSGQSVYLNPVKFGEKTADFTIDSMQWEAKDPKGYDQVAKNISRAYGQSNNIILHFKGNIDENRMKLKLSSYLKENSQWVENVWIIAKNINKKYARSLLI